MKDTIHISIFGLNLSLINSLKHSLTELLDDRFNLIWTNVTDPDLKLLIINSDFIDLAHIQKIKSSQIPILQIEKNLQYASKIHSNTLYLPFEDNTDLENWLENNAVPYLKSGKVRNLSTTQHTPSIQKADFAIFDHLFKNIFETSSAKFILKDHQNKIALLDLEQYCFYLNHDVTEINFDALSLDIASLNHVVHFRKNMNPQDLNQGLWNFVWEHMTFTDQTFNQNYLLKKWPQIKNFENRKDIFKLAAIFSEGSNIEYAKVQLKMSEKYIQQFLCVSKLAGILEEISTAQVKYKLSQHTTTPDTNQNSMISFFSKLRKKLGI